MGSKINQLLKRWPKGAVATASWLKARGVYRQLARRYVASGWIEPLGHGAFLRVGETVDWLGGLYALQNQLGLSVYAGASTALSLEGLGHFLPLGNKAEIRLFSELRETLPAWFRRYPWGVRVLHDCPRLFAESGPAGFTEVHRGALSVRVSAPERAILELLHLATTNAEIDHAVEVMNGLSTLRPRVVQSLLEGCRSVKVKRLFLWAAAAAGHEWFGRLAIARIDLGKGKRHLYRGGRFDPKYQITVPKTGGPSV
jgi:hypothetical protein